MKKIFLILLIAASVAMGAIVSTTGNCNISDLTFDVTDTLSIGHIVTVDENFQCDSMIITTGGQLNFNNGLKLTMTGGILLNGNATLILNQSDTIYFSGGNYLIRYGSAGNTFTISGSKANPAVITAEESYYWRFLRVSGSGGSNCHWNGFKFINTGSASTNSIDIQNDYDVAGNKPFVMKNGYFYNYGTVNIAGAYDDDDSIYVDSCIFINPIGTYAFAYVPSRIHDAGVVRKLQNLTLKSAVSKAFRIRGPSSAAIDVVNIFNCVSQNVPWDLGTECNVNFICSFNADATATSCITTNTNAGDTANIINSIAAGYSNRNYHLIGMGASVGVQNFWGCYSEGFDAAADDPEHDHFLSGTNAGTPINNIYKHVAINGGLLNCLHASNYTYNIYNSNTVEQQSTKAPFIIFETNNPTGGTRNAKNCILYTITSDYWSQSAVTGGSANLLHYMDYNAWDGRTISVDGYSDISVNGLTFGDVGWDNSSINSSNSLKSATFNIGTFYDKIRGGSSGTQRNVFAELFKMNGYDTLGNTATFSDTFTVKKLLGYLRAAQIPTNSALLTSGENGGLIGAVCKPLIFIDTVRSNDTLYHIDSVSSDLWFSDTTGGYRDSVNIQMIKKSAGSWVLSSSAGLKRASSRCTTFVKMGAADTIRVLAYGSEQLGGTYFSDTLPQITTTYSSGRRKPTGSDRIGVSTGTGL